jgi:hypothetical protein
MSTTIQRSQQVDFASQAMPELFHASPYQFMQYLGRDGTKFLRFYWDEVGKKMAEAERINPFGLNFEIRHPRSRITIALITLPKPRHEGESYFVAMIHRPYRITPFLGISDTTKVLCLESTSDSNGNERLLLVEWTRKMQREPLSTLPEADREVFYAAVLGEIKE